MVSSTGNPATVGVADSVCPKRRDDAATSQTKTIAHRRFTSGTVEATPESTSGKLMAFEEAMNFLRQFRADPCRRRDLLHRRLAQAIYGTKFPQEQILPVLTHARAIVENAFADPLLHQQLVIGVREAMRFVPNSLEQAERT